MIERNHEDLLRRLALNDERALTGVLAGASGLRLPAGVPDLGDKTKSYVLLAALIATQAAPTSYQSAVSNALSVGVSESEILGVLCTVAPVVGAARLQAASAALGNVLGTLA
jgi:alkylhydroperoxidase/carboxymuconolactone decarboxylase family protein YurZ